MAKSIKANFFYSSILTSANYIFPILTYPYISRVLGVEKVGACNFVDSIVAYLVLFSMMGISTVGVREIAKSKGDKEKTDSAYSSLIFLNTLTTVFAFVVFAISIFAVPALANYKALLIIGAVRLLCGYLQVEWLFLGLEEFKYITNRTIVVKLGYILGVYLFVHSSEDYLIYFALYSIMTLVNVIINLSYARKYVCFKIKSINIRPYIKPFFILGVYMVITSMYTSFNVTFLGFTNGDTEVGYYTTAIKLFSLLLSIFTAFTGVMLPRMSSLLANNKIDEFKNLLSRSLSIIVIYSIPVICLTYMMAPQIIMLISGPGYEGAILPMRIVVPLILIIGIEQVLVMQTLMPLSADIAILKNSTVGAVFGLIMNVLLVFSLASVGSAIVWGVSELAVLVCASISVYRLIKVHPPVLFIVKNIICYVPLLFVLSKVADFINDTILSLLCASVLTLLYMILINFTVLKNQEVFILYNQAKQLICNKIK